MYRQYLSRLGRLVETLSKVSLQEAQNYVGQLRDLTDKVISIINRSNNSDDNVMTVRRGQTFVLYRHERPSTGFSWYPRVSNGLEIIRDETIPANKPGGNSLRIWTIRATQTGPQQFVAIYRQPWPGGKTSDQVYRVNINVV